MGNMLTATDPTLSRMAASDAALSQARQGLGARKLADIDAAAKDFESMFISQMMSTMFETVPVDSEFGGGQAEETWRGLMVDEYAKNIVKAGGFGLSDAIKSEMIAMQQEATSK